MLSLPNAAAVRAVLQQSLNGDLSSILADWLGRTEAEGLGDLTHVIVVDSDDTEAAIHEAIGWSPLVHPIDGCRYGQAEFKPYWAYLHDRGGWYELIHPVGNDGFAYIVLLNKRANSDLTAMCREALERGEVSCN